MAIPISDIYVRLGDQNAVTEIKFVQGGWLSTGSLADIQAIDPTRVHDKQIAYSTDEGKFYIAAKTEQSSVFSPGPPPGVVVTPASLTWSELPIGFPYTGSAGITGSLVVDGPVSASLFSGSFYGDGSNLTGIGSGILVMTGSFGSSSVDLDTEALRFTGSAGGIIPTVSASRITFELSDELSATGSFLGSFTGSFSGSLSAPGTDGYVLYNSSSLVQATTALYFDDDNQRIGVGTETPTTKLDIHGDALITGSLTVQGRVTAEEFHTEFVSASILYQSGSTKFGDTSDDVHSFSGSLRVTGSGAHYFTDGNVGVGTASPAEKLTVAGNISASGDFYLDGALYDVNNEAGTSGQILQSTATGVDWVDPTGISVQAQQVFASVKNTSGGILYKGTPVHAVSASSSGNINPVIAASASDASSMPATFVLNEDLNDDEEGLAIAIGFIANIDTSAFEVGDIIYVGESGGYTNVKPTGSANLIQNLGVVTKKHASNGAGYVYGSGRSNDVPNLPIGKIWVGSDSYSVTSSLFHLDEDNGRLGIGTDSPSATLHVSGGLRLETYGEGDKISNSITYALGVDSNGTVLEIPQNTGANVDVDTGTEVIDSFASGSFYAAFTNYYAKQGTNLRAGQLMSVWDNTGNVEYTDVSTNSLGDTSGVLMFASVNGGNIEIKTTVDTDNWTVKVNTTLL